MLIWQFLLFFVIYLFTCFMFTLSKERVANEVARLVNNTSDEALRANSSHIGKFVGKTSRCFINSAPELDIPLLVHFFWAETISDKSITLVWGPYKLSGKMIRYRVSVSVCDNGDFRMIRLKYPRRGKRKSNFGKLQPNTKYKFLLQAIVKKLKNPSDFYVQDLGVKIVKTTIKKPELQRVDIINPTTIKVIWKQQHPPVYDYKVDVYLEFILDLEKEVLVSNGSIENSVFVSGLLPGTYHVVFVRSLHLNESSPAVTRKFATRPLPPDNMTLLKDVEERYYILWQHPRGGRSEYVFRYQVGEDKETFTSITIPRSENNFTASIPEKSIFHIVGYAVNDFRYDYAGAYWSKGYYLKVKTIADNGRSFQKLKTASVGRNFKFQKNAEKNTSNLNSHSPHHGISNGTNYYPWNESCMESNMSKVIFQLHWVSHRSLYMTWTGYQDGGPYVKYKFDIQACLENATVRHRMFDVSFGLTTSLIQNLTPATRYKINLFAWPKSRDGNFIFLGNKIVTTKLLPPALYRVSFTNSSSARLQWKPQLHPVVDYYFITKSSEFIEILFNQKRVRQASETKHTYINGLEPGTFYTTYVQSILGDNISEKLSVHYTTKPLPPANATVKKQSGTTYKVSWSHPIGDHDSYTFKLTCTSYYVNGTWDKTRTFVRNKGHFLINIAYDAIIEVTGYSTKGKMKSKKIKVCFHTQNIEVKSKLEFQIVKKKKKSTKARSRNS